MDQSHRMMLIIIVFSMLWILPARAQADKVALVSREWEPITLKQAKRTYRQTKINYEEQIALVKEEAKVALAEIQQRHRELSKQRQECQTFECAEAIDQEHIRLLGQSQQIKEAARLRELQLQNGFIESAQRLAVAAFVYEVGESIAAQKELDQIVRRPDSECGVLALGRGYAVGGSTFCRQLNLDFKRNGEFYRVRFAVGMGKGECQRGLRPGDNEDLQCRELMSALDQLFEQRLEPFVGPARLPNSLYRTGNELHQGFSQDGPYYEFRPSKYLGHVNLETRVH